jgi:hypothetical protein
MTMSTDYPPTRDDFRCFVCRNKEAFHCEHDTPYRDQYLGTFNASSPRNTIIIRPKTTSASGNVNSKSNGGTNPNRQIKSNVGARNQKNKKLDQKTTADNEADQTPEEDEETPKSKSCVIL